MARLVQAPVFDLPVHRTSAWMFNCYALTDASGGAVLVDAGLPSTAGGALDALAGDGVAAESVSAIIATHGHSDHLAGIPLAQERTVARVHLPGRCESYLRGETPKSFGRDANIRFLPMWGQHPFTLGAARELVAGAKVGFGGPQAEFRIPFEPASFLDDGDPVPGLPGWTVVASPGHTECSISLHHRDSATLLSGDAVLTHDGRAWFNPEWVDAGVCAETEARLRSLEVRHLLPGHGLPIEAADVWAGARSMRNCPEGKGLLTRCARRWGKWDAP